MATRDGDPRGLDSGLKSAASCHLACMKKRRRQLRLPKLVLQPVDELITAREQLHGGGPGAPPLVGRAVREGAALNKSCVMMLSALLQGYVEEVFLHASRRLFRTLRGDDVIKRYRRTYFRWGNPSHENIKALFQRLGIDDVFDGLSWQNTSPDQIAVKLNRINEIKTRSHTGSNFLKRYRFLKLGPCAILLISLAVASRHTSEESYRDDHSDLPAPHQLNHYVACIRSTSEWRSCLHPKAFGSRS